MPWRETSAMEERIRFVKDHRSGVFEMRELCGRYGISRKTGYKWLQGVGRRRDAGSRAPGFEAAPRGFRPRRSPSLPLETPLPRPSSHFRYANVLSDAQPGSVGVEGALLGLGFRRRQLLGRLGPVLRGALAEEA